MGNYVRWHFECDLCGSSTTASERFGGETVTVAIPPLPYNWKRVGEFIVCPKHSIDVDNGSITVGEKNG